MSFYTEKELAQIGLGAFGDDVRISRFARLYNPGAIRIGSHVRIDDFCVLSAGEGGIEIGDHVHIAVYCSLMGQGKISMADFSGLSSRVSIYSSNDDYLGRALTNPTVPSRFTKVSHAPVALERHVIVGAGSIVLPGVVLAEGVAIGALSLVAKSCEPFGIYAGNPLRRIRARSRDLLDQEALLRSSTKSDGQASE